MSIIETNAAQDAFYRQHDRTQDAGPELDYPSRSFEFLAQMSSQGLRNEDGYPITAWDVDRAIDRAVIKVRDIEEIHLDPEHYLRDWLAIEWAVEVDLREGSS